jgi:hypothetical protein
LTSIAAFAGLGAAGDVALTTGFAGGSGLASREDLTSSGRLILPVGSAFTGDFNSALDSDFAMDFAGTTAFAFAAGLNSATGLATDFADGFGSTAFTAGLRAVFRGVSAAAAFTVFARVLGRTGVTLRARGFTVLVFFGFFITTVLATGVARLQLEIKPGISAAQR